MIQFNLLPDVKLEYLKAQRLKRVVMVVSTLVSAAALTVFVILLMAVQVVQKRHLGNLTEDIRLDSATLKAVPEIDKILTVQNQLTSLPPLHNQKPVASRLVGYLSQVTPAQVSISKLNVDFANKTMRFTGDADALSTVNKFVDTLKFTDYAVPDGSKQGKAFSNVVLTEFARDAQGATYQIDLVFDAAIFDRAANVALTVPKIITTRSETEKPGELFKETPIERQQLNQRQGR